MTDTPPLCACGCGKPVKRSHRSSYRRGDWNEYVRGHQIGRGAQHMAWKGGASISPNGYRVVIAPDGRRRHEHVLICEQAMGRPLPRGAVVHHVNGDRLDNRPHNLVVCEDAGYHMLLHKRQRAMDACGDPNAHRCVFCGGYERQDEMTVCALRNGSERAYHRECNAAAGRDYKARRRQEAA